MFDLLTTVENGGCSAKIPAQKLTEILKELNIKKSSKLIVGFDSADDAMVWKLNSETALIFTTDFFPPICSDPYEFGQIAAANSISDIYAMGGQGIMALNLVMFPSSSIDLEVLKQILKGGHDKSIEAGIVLSGGHTIDDSPPKYGLAVLGIVHPERVISNTSAREGDQLILTKAIGTGVLTAGKKTVPDSVKIEDYQAGLDSMKLLNKEASRVMQDHNIRCATDITGFGLLGHCLNIARESNKTLLIDSVKVPLLPGTYDLIEMGCISCAAFNNLKSVEAYTFFDDNLDYNMKMAAVDAQTSGGILMCVPPQKTQGILQELKGYYPWSALVGEVISPRDDGCRIMIK